MNTIKYDISCGYSFICIELIRLVAKQYLHGKKWMISIGVLSADGTGKINQAGVDHYNRLINALIAEGRFIRIIWKKIKGFSLHFINT